MAKAGQVKTVTTKDKDFAGPGVQAQKAVDPPQAIITCEDVLKRIKEQGK